MEEEEKVEEWWWKCRYDHEKKEDGDWLEGRRWLVLRRGQECEEENR